MSATEVVRDGRWFEYSDSHPHVQSAEFFERMRATNLAGAMRYPNFEGVRVRVRLPAHYDENTPHPLILYLKFDHVPSSVIEVFDARHVIWAFVDNTETQLGEDSWVQRNAQLALNAAHNLRQNFAVDPERIYVGGVSGGAASAINVAPVFPDVFRGGLFFASGGDLDVSTVPQPQGEFSQSKGRYFFATGDQDRSQAELLHHYRAFEAAGYANLFLVNEPAVGHETPEGRYFEPGWAFLEGTGPGSPKGAADERGTASWLRSRTSKIFHSCSLSATRGAPVPWLPGILGLAFLAGIHRRRGSRVASGDRRSLLLHAMLELASDRGGIGASESAVASRTKRGL